MTVSRSSLARFGAVALAASLLTTVSIFIYIGQMDSDTQQGIEIPRCALLGLLPAVPSAFLCGFAKGWSRVWRVALSLLLVSMWWFAHTHS